MNHMAVSPKTTTSAPLSGLATQRRAEDGVRARAGGSAWAVPAGTATTPGLLVGRPDLSDEAVLQAIAERMSFEGRDASKAKAVLDAALAGRPVACAFLRRLVLPPPQSSLQMPIQSILREPVATGEAKGSWLSRLSLGR
ncbi:hypothetical protein ASG54_00870 [Aureimonas sp. Leaf460]|nr:hypothetical protein ASG62_03600 [Aureimonas sp. Leaf427]KQT81293.1 hypothetical protein ASG54_00870 [Aureimonas sp. Leaf460]